MVTPPEMASFFAEKLLLLPNSYHYNGHDSLYAHLFDPNGRDAHTCSKKLGRFWVFLDLIGSELSL